MSVLFTLLRDWVRSVKGGFIPPERRNEFILLVEREEDEKLYQKVLELPLAVSSTILYVVRFIWQLMLFPKSVNRNPDSSVCFYSSLYPTSIVADALGNSSQLGAMIIVLLRAVAVHEREPFLPPDPMESEIDQFKVLLFSHIAPSPSKNLPYEYTLSALRTLEQTAENMFQYGLLPPTNCFGCSPHRLPRSPSAPIRLFDPSTSYFLKTPETKVYSVGHMWFSPFLDGIHVVLDGGWECTIPMSDIQVLFPFLSLSPSKSLSSCPAISSNTSAAASSRAVSRSSRRSSVAPSTWFCSRPSVATPCSTFSTSTSSGAAPKPALSTRATPLSPPPSAYPSISFLLIARASCCRSSPSRRCAAPRRSTPRWRASCTTPS